MQDTRLGLCRRPLNSLLLDAVALSLTCVFFGCDGSREFLKVDPGQARAFSPERMELLQKRMRALEDSVMLLSCSPELRAFFRDIRQECSSSREEIEAKAPLRGGPVSPSCPSESLAGAIAVAERDRTRQLMSMLLALRHEVVYLPSNGKLAPARARRLAILAAEPRLPSTRYLVMTAPVRNRDEASRRAGLVIEELIRMGIPALEPIDDGISERRVPRFDRPWLYSLSVPPQQLRVVDRPIPPEPNEPQKAVYIFRTDCL